MANDAFKALAHPLRRDIVGRLNGGVATVGDVSRDFGASKPTISRHLKMLEEAGVVSRVNPIFSPLVAVAADAGATGARSARRRGCVRAAH
jgi:DNA-binding transcriptional ArsR family regulator